MQTVYIIHSNRSYVSHLTKLGEQGFNVTLLPLKLAEKTFLECIDREEQGTFVVDINAVDLINIFLDIINKNYPISENIRLLVVSDLQSWANTLPTAYANNITGGFRRRNPVAGALEKYSLENTLYDVARSGIISLKIVYLGMVYGGRGHDFEKIFMDIWSNKFVLPSPPSSSLASNPALVGHIHIARFLSLFSDVISDPSSYSSLVPAFDCNSRPLVDILVACNLKVNPDATPTVSDEETALRLLLKEGKYAANVAAFIPTLQVSKHNFDKQSNMEVQWDSIWSEFVASNGLRPVKCLVAGPPKTGKTEQSKAIAERLQIKYVDGYSAVHYALMFTPPVPAAVDSSEADSTTEPTDDEKLTSLRTQLIAAIDAKLAEGAKPSKDKNAAPKTIVNSEGKVDETQINLTVVNSAISADLQRQCVRSFVRRDVTCLRKGYVLDMWENEGLRPVHEYLGESNPDETNRSPAIDVVFELQCDDKVMVQQLQESYGAGFAKNKEGQAAVKALEASLSAYSAGLTTYISAPRIVGDSNDSSEVPAEETKNTASEEPKQVHAIVKAILENVAGVCLIQRDMTVGGVGSNAARAEDVSLEILSVKKDALGWCRSSSETSNVAVDGPSTVGETPAADVPSSTSANAAVSPASIPAKVVDTNKIKGLQTMNDFLTNTVLPILASGMISAIRNDVPDPIAYLADFLLAESAERQTRCEEEAKQKFEDLLRNC